MTAETSLTPVVGFHPDLESDKATTMVALPCPPRSVSDCEWVLLFQNLRVRPCVAAWQLEDSSTNTAGISSKRRGPVGSSGI